LKAAQPIKSSALYERGASPPLEVAKNMSAVSVGLGTSALIDGLIKPGQYVDVHFSTLPSDNDPRYRGGMSMTLFKGVKILAINRQFRQGPVDDNRVNSATLEVTTEQANILLVLQPRGTLSLSFNPDGKGDGGLALADKDRVTLEEILSLEPIKDPEPPPPPFVSQIYRGAGRQELEFKKNNTVNDRFGCVLPQRDPAGAAPGGNPPARDDNAPGDSGTAQPAPQAQPAQPPVPQEPQPRTAAAKSA
jgi:pilus assembly protein CpaB